MVHLVGFTIEILRDARSYKRQIHHVSGWTQELPVPKLPCAVFCQSKSFNLPEYSFFGLFEITQCIPLVNPLNHELNPICYLLALLAHHFLHVSRIRVKSLTLRLLMSYIYGALILDVSRSHTTTQHSQYDSSGRVISSSQRPLPDNTRHSQQTNIHAPGGIRTHDFSR